MVAGKILGRIAGAGRWSVSSAVGLPPIMTRYASWRFPRAAPEPGMDALRPSPGVSVPIEGEATSFPSKVRQRPTYLMQISMPDALTSAFTALNRQTRGDLPQLDGCDARSHVASELADRRADFGRWPVPGQCSMARARSDVRHR